MTVEFDKFHSPKLFSIPAKILKIWVFELHEIAIYSSYGTCWVFFLKSMIIQLSVSEFLERLIKK